MNAESSNRNYRIVVVDDDVIQMRPFFVEMGMRGIDVVSMTDADQCVEYVESGNEAELFVIDIMLHSAERYSAILTNSYQLTGLSLARDIRKHIEAVPIMLFSNTARNELVTEIRNVAKKIGNCVFVQKHTIHEFGQFSDLVERIVREGVKDITSKSFWERFKEGVFLRPSFCGIGVDIKTLSKK